MLVACILVNRTTWEVARFAHAELYWHWRTPEHLAQADLRTLRPMVKYLGLVTARSHNLRDLARSWQERRPKTAEDVTGLPGCGKYAADSWAIFVEGRTDVYPDDGKLTWYMRSKQ